MATTNSAELDGVLLGETIRRFRRRREMTMEALARATGLSTAMISKVESGSGNPSLKSLRQIAHALKVPVAVLFAQEADAGDGARTEAYVNHKRIYSYRGATYTVLLSPFSSVTKFLMLVAEPGAELGGPAFPHLPHDGFEQGILVEGELTFVVSGSEHVLRPFDTIAYPSSLQHGWINRGDVPARAIWAVTITDAPAEAPTEWTP